MKKIIILICCCMALIVSCSHKKNEYYEFPKTNWEMNVNDVLTAYDVDEKDVKYNTEYTLVIENQIVFGEKTSDITFQFYDPEGKNHTLHQVVVNYPYDANMSKVLKSMKKEYGITTPRLTLFSDYNNLFDTKLIEYSTEETEHLKLWSSISLKERIPTEELESYRSYWMKYMKSLQQNDNWEAFIENATMLNIAWTDNDEIPILKEKGLSIQNELYFDATNYMFYNYINKQ